MTNPFLKRYQDQDLVVQTRAKNLSWLLVIFAVALAGLAVVVLTQVASPTAILAGVLAVLFLVPLELLRRGHYKTAANVTFVLLLAGATISTFQNRLGWAEDDYYRLTATFALGIVLTGFFGYHWWMGVVMGGAGIVCMVVMAFTPFAPEAASRTVADLAKGSTPQIVVVIYVVLAAAATMGLYQTSRILVRNRESQEITQRGFDDVRQVFRQAQAGIEVGRTMETTARELQAGSDSIGEELVLFGAQTANLSEQAKEAGHASRVLEEIQTSLHDKMEAQVRSIHQTSSALEEINALFQNMAAASRSKKESLEGLGRQARDGERQVAEMVGAFATMQKTAEDVLNVVQVIEDISSRTNLLAMNASIEAAHAGNAGRGFGVVAGEIRKLAEETNRNSQAIRRTLDANLDQVHTAVEAGRASQVVLASVISAFQDIQSLLAEQLGGMEELGQGTREILHSVDQLRAGTSGVQEAAQSLAGAVTANRHQAASVQDAAQVLSEGVYALQTVADTIAASARTVREFGERNLGEATTLQANLERVSSHMEERRSKLK
jgi:methyl-accepting chemotaxis protein